VQFINYSVPGAVTVVPVDAWGRAIDPRNVRRIDQQRLAAQRATLDPLTLTPLRNAFVHSAQSTFGRGKIDLPPGIAKKLNDTRVIVSSDVRQSKFRKDLEKSMRVERVSDTARNQKFKVRDERQESQQADTGRKQEIDRLSAEAAKGNKQAQQQARQLEQQQRKETRDQEKVTRAQEKAARTQAPAQQPALQKAQQPAQPRAQQRVQQPLQQKAQQKFERRAQQQPVRPAQPQPRAERVGNPAKPARSEARPEARQQSQGPAKQERQQKVAQPGAQGHGGGKGKKP
jgi:hypothetical protein